MFTFRSKNKVHSRQAVSSLLQRGLCHCFALAWFGFLSITTYGQFQDVSTIAGSGESGPAFLMSGALQATLSNPFGVEPIGREALIITSYDQHVVYRLDLKSQQIVRIAGSGRMGSQGKSGDKALEVEFNQPHEARVDRDGNIYVADTRNHRVGVIEARTGIWRTIAGNGTAGFSGNGGPATQAALNGPHSIALDGNELFIADLANHRVRKVDLTTGVITTVAGTGQARAPADNQPALDQPLHGPRSLAIDPENVWIVLREGNSIWRFDRRTQRIHHIAGNGEKGFTGDGGQARVATFNGPKGIAVDPGKSLYIVDTENHAIRQVDLKTSTITTVVGSRTGERGFNGDGKDPVTRLLARPHGVAIWPSGGIVIGDSENHRVRVAKGNPPN